MSQVKNGLRHSHLARLLLLALAVLMGALSFFHEGFLYPLLAVWILGPPVWVFLNARTARVKGAFLWALLALFANVIGMIVYYIATAGPLEGGGEVCPDCGREIRAYFSRCPFCGRILIANAAVSYNNECSHCGAPVDDDWRYCPFCRVDLADFTRCNTCEAPVKESWKVCPLCAARISTAQAE